jgi:hypothetical protein
MRFAVCTLFLPAIVAGAAAAAPKLATGAPVGGALFVAERSLLLPGTRLVDDPGSAGAGGELQQTSEPGGRAQPSRRRYVLPVVLSALVPGAGEIAAGHPWRGLPLVAADVATWIGYAHFRSEGRDWRTRYEQYADSHWNYSLFGDTNGNGDNDPDEAWGWQENLERYFDASQSDAALRWWDPNAPYNCNCPYVSREDDRQHYYENIGKYRYYWMGWDDWEYNAASAVDSDSRSHRREYGLMRIESNENFDRATQLIVVGMATRLASVVQSALLVRADMNREREFSLRPAVLPGRAAGIEMSLKY